MPVKRTILALLVLSVGALAQGTAPSLGSNNTFTGTNIFNGPLLVTSAGVFSSAQQSEYAQVLLNGIDPKTEYQSGGFLQNQTEALVGGLAVPSTATVIQANAVSGYANTSSTVTNTVAGYFHCRSLVTNSVCWGFNPLAVSTVGHPANLIVGEIDLNIANTGDTGCGICLAGFWLAQPIAPGGANGFVVGKPGGPGDFYWNVGLLTSAGCCLNAAIVGPANTGAANVASQNVIFQNVDGSGIRQTNSFFVDAAGDFQMFPTGGHVQVNGNASITQKISGYNGVSTVKSGVPAEYAFVDATAQGAALSAQSIIASLPQSGFYRVTWTAKVTQAATSSSTLGGSTGFQVVYTDADDSTASVTSPTVSGGPTGNALTTQWSGTVNINGKVGTAVTCNFGYTSSGGTPMQYAIKIRMEAL